MKTRSCKNKGALYQKEIASELSAITGIPFEKDGDIDVRTMGNSGTDVILRGKALEMLPFSIECKRQESWSVPAYIEQAKSNQKEGTEWLLFVRKNKSKSIVIMDADKFFKLLKKVIDHEGSVSF